MRQCPRCGSTDKDNFMTTCRYSNSHDPWHDKPTDSAPVADRLPTSPSTEDVGPAAGDGDTPMPPDEWADLTTFAKYTEYAELCGMWVEMKSQRNEARRERDEKDSQLTSCYARMDKAEREAEALRKEAKLNYYNPGIAAPIRPAAPPD